MPITAIVATKSAAAVAAIAIGTFGGFNYVNCGCVFGTCSIANLSLAASPISTVVDTYPAQPAVHTQAPKTEQSMSCCKPPGRAAVIAGVDQPHDSSCQLHGTAPETHVDADG